MTLTQINKAGLDEIALDHVFTIGASGSSAYTFQGEGLNGTVNNPTLYLTRGKTYRFENGSGGHPIRIQSTSGASGTAYNTGVTNNAGSGTVIVEVQHDAPDVLYYQCTSHSSMNGILYITGALADGGVTTAKLATGAVTAAKIANNTITATQIGANAVGASELGNSSVAADNLQGNSVTTAKIANDAVTGSKILNGAVSLGKLASGSVPTSAIIDTAVTLAKLEHGTSSNDGKFLRANNGADPTFETVNTDLVSDTSPQLGGVLNSNGHDIDFADGDKARFGSSQDLIIHHDGNNSFIDEAGTGDLLLTATAGSIQLKKNTGEKMLQANVDGAVELYNDGTKKCETTANGLKLSNLPDNSFMLLDQNGRQSALNNYFSSGSTGSRIGVDISTGTTDGAKTRSVDFWPDGMSFNGDTASANRIDDYEEGNHTFTERHSSVSITSYRGYYIKVGSFVFVSGSVYIPSNSNGNTLKLTLPFTSNIGSYFAGGGYITYTNIDSTYRTNLMISVENNAADAHFRYGGGSLLSCSAFSNRRVDFNLEYQRT